MLGDTIQAISSPPGSGARGIVRISGPEALAAASRVLGVGLARRRQSLEARIRIAGGLVDCLVLIMPAPRSFTGEDLVELHLPGSPLLLAMVADQLEPECRPAAPGEFTRRAFDNDRLDLVEAEAILALISADTIEERRHAMAVLSGELRSEVESCRGQIQDALALVEAGLDFSSGETGEIEREQWAPIVDSARAKADALRAGLPATRGGGCLFLVGAANAGKSSLCNALAGKDVVLVDAEAGTTRDVLSVDLGDGLSLFDSPGDLDSPEGSDRRSMQLRRKIEAGSAGAIYVLDGQDPKWPDSELPPTAVVLTKQDLGETSLADWDDPEVPLLRTSAKDGRGISELRAFLVGRSSSARRTEGHRVQALLERCGRHLAQALAPELGGQPELVALELGEALSLLDQISGRSSPEDLLDRIFAGFCLGK